MAAVLGLQLGYAVQYACTGIATMIVIYALGEVGVHTNPITTLAFAVRGDIAWKRVFGHLVAQLAGAVAAGAFVAVLLHPPSRALLPQLAFGPWPAFWLEIVLTAILIAVNLATANQGRTIGAEAAVANGGATVFDRWISGPISGGSMNPSRTLGPALIAGGTSAWWVYVSAPAIGGCIAVALVWLIFGSPTPDERRRGGG